MVKRNICICFTFKAIHHFGSLTFSVIKDFQKKYANNKVEAADNPAQSSSAIMFWVETSF